MRKLLIYLREFRKECILAPLFKLLEAILELFVPVIVATMIDGGISGGDRGLILRSGLLLLALALAGLIMAVTAQWFAARAATGFAARVKTALMRRIQSLSARQQDALGAPTLIGRLTGDMNQVQTGVNLTLRLLLRSPFVVLGALIMAFTVDAKAALVFAALIPVLSLCVFLVMKATLPRYRDIQEASDGVLGVTRENLTGVRVIRAFGMEENEEARFVGRHDRLTRLQIATQRVAAALNPLTLLIVDIALAILIYVGAVRVDVGALSQGRVVALTNYMSQILVELIKLANLLITISKSLACAERISDVLAVEPDMASGSETPDWAARPLIQMEGVSLSYGGEGKEAIRDVSLTLDAGESLGIIGGTGSGKSSVAALIPRLYDATAGRVLVGGRDVRALDLAALRAGIGYVPQKARLFRGTVRDNLLMGNRQATDDMLWAALRTAQCEDFVRALPEGLDAPVEQNGRNFSGGQRQRLTIARALVRKPAVLILDDSASALDAKTDAELRAALRRDQEEAALIVISQRASSVMALDRILVLDDGVVVGYGTHERLLSDCPVYRETYEAQFPPEKEAV
ncbi:MAG: ABC transporter ATP-binding protein [Clostridia bacterium]|nr:ABC transporter ATP-binding protein [Clostridia bacterium]